MLALCVMRVCTLLWSGLVGYILCNLITDKGTETQVRSRVDESPQIRGRVSICAQVSRLCGTPHHARLWLGRVCVCPCVCVGRGLWAWLTRF